MIPLDKLKSVSSKLLTPVQSVVLFPFNKLQTQTTAKVLSYSPTLSSKLLVKYLSYEFLTKEETQTLIKELSKPIPEDIKVTLNAEPFLKVLQNWNSKVLTEPIKQVFQQDFKTYLETIKTYIEQNKKLQQSNKELLQEIQSTLEKEVNLLDSSDEDRQRIISLIQKIREKDLDKITDNLYNLESKFQLIANPKSELATTPLSPEQLFSKLESFYKGLTGGGFREYARTFLEQKVWGISPELGFLVSLFGDKIFGLGGKVLGKGGRLLGRTLSKTGLGSKAIQVLTKVGLKAPITTGGIVSTATNVGKLGTVLNVGKGLLSKLALPLTVALGAYSAYKGFRNAEEIFGKDATLAQKLESAGAKVVSDFTFGLVSQEKVAKGLDWLNNKILKYTPYGVLFNLLNTKPFSESRTSVRDEIDKSQGAFSNLDKLLLAQIKVESNFNPKAVSRVGATGLAQFMPATWKEIWTKKEFYAKYNPNLLKYENIPDITDPKAQLEAQKAYMSYLLSQFNGDVRWALASYNYGIGRVKKLYTKYGGDFTKAFTELPRETKSYIAKILSIANNPAQLSTLLPKAKQLGLGFDFRVKPTEKRGGVVNKDINTNLASNTTNQPTQQVVVMNNTNQPYIQDKPSEETIILSKLLLGY